MIKDITCISTAPSCHLSDPAGRRVLLDQSGPCDPGHVRTGRRWYLSVKQVKATDRDKIGTMQYPQEHDNRVSRFACSYHQASNG